MRGLVLGKFLPYHAGHAHLIRSARARVDELTVLVCSLAREPIDGALRHAWVAESHPDCRVVHVQDDVPQHPHEHPAFWEIWTALVARYAGRVDVVFTSESYGDELAACLGARHVCVDPTRATFPVSGTAVRHDPLANWRFLPPPVRAHFALRVAIVGAESTGKTTLAGELARRFETTWVPEFGRDYCEGRDVLALTLDDFDRIGRGQLAAEDAAARVANRLLICDTELLTTCTWSDMIAGARPEWLAEHAPRQRYAHVLLLSDDVPWIDDGTRVLAGRRREHTERLRRELTAAGLSFDELRGSYDERIAQADAIVSRLLSTRK
jgi:NadR type nicotinamide-nucleotide adenylyltransferase